MSEQLLCAVCGETASLDAALVVAAAQVIAFVDAHIEHDRLAIKFQVGSPAGHGGSQQGSESA